jgi:hypothetical protein
MTNVSPSLPREHGNVQVVSKVKDIMGNRDEKPKMDDTHTCFGRVKLY